MRRQAYYSDTILNFLNTDDDSILGKLNLGATNFSSQWTITTTSWDSSIKILKKSFLEIIKLYSNAKNWNILFEYEIPRLLSRIDVVLLAEDLIFIIEFKYDRKSFDLSDIRQVEDYALDLKDFHYESRNRKIIPILLAPLAKSVSTKNKCILINEIHPTIKSNQEDLADLIFQSFQKNHEEANERVSLIEWANSEYQPTPTIIQAARALFAGQSVEAISKTGAAEINLTRTSKYLIDKINEARSNDKKIICFVTGVPGAGKTLVGLNVIHERDAFNGDEFNTAYFSGNGPLINVLREALARDDYKKKKELFDAKLIQKKPTKDASHHEVKSKIQNLHSFIKECIRKETPPSERIVVFDEAQRCWNATHFFNQSKRNQNRERNPYDLQEKSEAELLFEFMNRHDGWSVIIALVGGGQEINTGEAGISEWGRVLNEKYPNWEVHISPQLLLGDSVTAGQTLFNTLPDEVSVKTNEDLHLSVSQRSFKASNLNNWVNALIENRPEKAQEVANSIQEKYPLLLTRDLEKAKYWLREQIVGTKRVGLVASSGGVRLRPFGINVKESIDEAYWFLNEETDIRSSYYLELVATEFAVQGLELDWIGICWDADLRRKEEEWDFKNFSGTKWENNKVVSEQQYLLNKYRVLLTRAREGLVIFVPNGDNNDETRLPEFYDPIYNYLKSCGLKEI